MTAALHFLRANRRQANVVARAATVYLLVPWSVAVDPEATEAAEIMGRYCRGDAAAFQRLYTLLAPRMLAYLFGLLRDKAAAEDILQATFLKVHEARPTYVLRRQPDPLDVHHCPPHLPRRDPQAKAQPRAAHQGRNAATEPAADLTGVPAEAGQDEAARPIPPRPPARSPRSTSSPRTSARRCS